MREGSVTKLQYQNIFNLKVQGIVFMMSQRHIWTSLQLILSKRVRPVHPEQVLDLNLVNIREEIPEVNTNPIKFFFSSINSVI